MRSVFLTLFIGALSLSLYSQDSVSQPAVLLRPYVENGIDFIRNDQLKQNYETQSKYFWGFGFQLGHPDIFAIFPYVQFSLSEFEIEKTIAPDVTTDHALTTRQITGGLIVPLKKVEPTYYRARLGYSYSKIKESFDDIDADSHGFQIGFGVERKVIRNSRIYIDLSYNYQKTVKSEFRDFDMTKLSLGFIL
jgi:opacity protein-like surface antigen